MRKQYCLKKIYFIEHHSIYPNNTTNNQFQGLNVHTEDILRDPSQIKEIVEHGLIAFCW